MSKKIEHVFVETEPNFTSYFGIELSNGHFHYSDSIPNFEMREKLAAMQRLVTPTETVKTNKYEFCNRGFKSICNSLKEMAAQFKEQNEQCIG